MESSSELSENPSLGGEASPDEAPSAMASFISVKLKTVTVLVVLV
jgi:hypothetical protein